MTDSNRTRLSLVPETTLGTLPASPRMRTMRFTNETLKFTPSFTDSNELRSDRMTADAVQTFQQNSGTVTFEVSYPRDNSAHSYMYESALFNAWVNTPSRDNDGTADSVITDIGTSSNTAVFTTGATFVASQLVYNSGFTNGANNGLFPVTTGGATSLVSTGSSWVAEAAPPAAARIKVVGFQGASGDIVATSAGLTSTALSFTTMGLAVGMWIKIGGTGSSFRYTGTTANNDFARISAISANLLTLDTKPTGWAADTGSGKTIRVFFGDGLINGVTTKPLSIEKAYLGQTVPTYALHSGMVAGTLSLNYASRSMITGSIDFSGTTAAFGTAAYGNSYVAAPTDAVMSGNVNVPRMTEAGATIIGPNWVSTMTLALNNNLRVLDAIGYAQAVDIGAGEAGLTGSSDTYFGDGTLYTKLIAGTASNTSVRATSSTRAFIVTVPRLLYTDGAPNVSGKNTDIKLNLSWRASIDETTSSEIRIDRMDYYEA